MPGALCLGMIVTRINVFVQPYPGPGTVIPHRVASTILYWEHLVSVTMEDHTELARPITSCYFSKNHIVKRDFMKHQISSPPTYRNGHDM